ncbi:SAM-dependent methyltransferase [Bordetella avium]|uniref:Cyclopropane-fatty-acyl-phospholipid synthase n=1 Tax=Bordetella avium (strain 197N) TaxID=360910 RepID=Q2KZJ9_BORA1|nr:cyclopropane-fatty-acyl-phospholipid synthase family protein [Bordetella avium]AZY49397.1 class I SAM-dependent methyltransferase [Bordetella avium]AZY52750.1 class I SAM-dependent methyltransferase [Bordetella avium]RIQ12093.1 class I SAM-dependent methyltransferase [Bordetella avium]RIQ19089.1 class I SAM-dependent methyltransferase [Bordetella avium]RIQ31999.1 class I SAM-dependent methyltransferase [Bordetella avium]
MNTSPASLPLSLPAGLPSVARHCLRVLQRLQQGTLHLELPDGSTLQLGQGGQPHASLVLRDWGVFAAVLRSGDIGLAEAYIAGDWSTPNVADLLRLMLANRQALESLVYGSWWGRLAYRLKHLLNRNTRAGSRRNIHAHYDLGNAFYRLWLDPSMNYSSAWFQGNLAGDLTQAQHAKVRRALHGAELRPGCRLLEIGCGWGALAEMAAGEFQAHVTGVTLSSEQLAYAQQRLHQAGLASQADLRLQDYRDIQDPPFDAICSIEMVEAVGQAYWPSYFSTLARLLKPGGRACVQSIVIDDALFERYVRGTDFIQQYVFPGGCLPSPARFRAEAQQAGLRVVEAFSFGPDYAETLRRWRQQFMQQGAQVLALGFDTQFLRTWEFYLAYCEAAFDSGNIDVAQYILVKD